MRWLMHTSIPSPKSIHTPVVYPPLALKNPRVSQFSSFKWKNVHNYLGFGVQVEDSAFAGQEAHQASAVIEISDNVKPQINTQ